MFEQYTLSVLLWCAVALLCGGIIKGALGVGTPLLTVPLMALVLPPRLAVTIMVVPVIVANLWQALRAPRVSYVIKTFWPVFTAILVGTWLGVSIFAYLNEQALLLVVAVAVIVFAILQFSRYRFSIPPHLAKPVGAVFGLISGIVGGISSFFGPMLVIYLVSLRDKSKEEFIGAISFLYIGAVVPWACVLYYFGILSAQLLAQSSIATLPVVLGMVIGNKLRKLISEYRFQHLIALVLIGSAAVILWRALA